MVRCSDFLLHIVTGLLHIVTDLEVPSKSVRMLFCSQVLYRSHLKRKSYQIAQGEAASQPLTHANSIIN